MLISFSLHFFFLFAGSLVFFFFRKVKLKWRHFCRILHQLFWMIELDYSPCSVLLSVDRTWYGRCHLCKHFFYIRWIFCWCFKKKEFLNDQHRPESRLFFFGNKWLRSFFTFPSAYSTLLLSFQSHLAPTKIWHACLLAYWSTSWSHCFTCSNDFLREKSKWKSSFIHFLDDRLNPQGDSINNDYSMNSRIIKSFQCSGTFSAECVPLNNKNQTTFVTWFSKCE